MTPAIIDTAPRTDALARREVLPGWLATACVLSGSSPPDLTEPFRYVHLGCRHAGTPTLTAALHPNAQVWAWDWRRRDTEHVGAVHGSTGLANLEVGCSSTLPSDLGGAPADIVVVDEILVAASDELRSQITEAIRTSLKPGGLVCISYQTVVGWTEIAPIVHLMRYVAERHEGDAVAHVLGLLQQLRSGGAKHLTERPRVAAWLDRLATMDPAAIEDHYLLDPFRPISHAQVSDEMTRAGCEFVTSARVADQLDLEVPTPLFTMVNEAPTRRLQESYRDLSLRATERLDVFRRGTASLAPAQQRAWLEALGLAGAPAAAANEPSVDMHPDTWVLLSAGTIPASMLDVDPDDLADSLRILLQDGQAFPVVPGAPAPDAAQLERLGIGWR